MPRPPKSNPPLTGSAQSHSDNNAPVHQRTGSGRHRNTRHNPDARVGGGNDLPPTRLADDGPPPAGRGAELEDRQYRHTHPGVLLRSAYLTIIGENPDASPGDQRTAAGMVAKIEAALSRGGWTRAENRRLHQMLHKWRARAYGRDVWYEMFGNRGGLSLTPRQQHDYEFRSIVRKMKGIIDGTEID